MLQTALSQTTSKIPQTKKNSITNIKFTISQLDKLTLEQIVEAMKDESPRSFNEVIEAKKYLEKIKYLNRIDTPFKFTFREWQIELFQRISLPNQDDRKIIFLCDFLTEGGTGKTTFCEWLGSLPGSSKNLPAVNCFSDTKSPSIVSPFLLEKEEEDPTTITPRKNRRFHYIDILDEPTSIEEYLSAITFAPDCLINIFLVDVPRASTELLPYSLLQRLKDGKWSVRGNGNNNNMKLFNSSSLKKSTCSTNSGFIIENEGGQEQENIVVVCMDALPDFTKLSQDQFEIHSIDPISNSLKPYNKSE